jgi:hypothetical protein
MHGRHFFRPGSTPRPVLMLMRMHSADAAAQAEHAARRAALREAYVLVEVARVLVLLVHVENQLREERLRGERRARDRAWPHAQLTSPRGLSGSRPPSAAIRRSVRAMSCLRAPLSTCSSVTKTSRLPCGEGGEGGR